MKSMHQHAEHTDEARQSNAGRQHLMAACAAATDGEFAQAMELFEGIVNCDTAVDVRQPEVGMVMMRGRMGGDGAPFNIGEATVTRAVVRLETGEIGYSYLLGRSKQRARMAAILDAIAQSSEERMAKLEDGFVAPVAKRAEAARQSQRAETEATRVNFFTMVRGDD